MTTTGAQAGGVTDIKTGTDGYLYVVDYAGGKLYRFGATDDTRMDALMNGGGPEAVVGDTKMWIETAPSTYNWQYGDLVTYQLMTPPGFPAIDPDKTSTRTH